MCNCMREHCSMCHYKWLAINDKILSDSLGVDIKYFKSLPDKATEYTHDLYNNIMGAYMCYATDNGIEWSFPELFSKAESFPPKGEFMVKFGWFQYEYLNHINSPFAERLKPDPIEPIMPNGWSSYVDM